MHSGNPTREIPHRTASKERHLNDAGRPSPALQGATLAFSSSSALSARSKAGHAGSNGALAAASSAGLGGGRSARQSSFGADLVNDSRGLERLPDRQIRRRVSANNGVLLESASVSSREQSPSHIAAIMAATSSRPTRVSLGPPPASTSRRPSPLQRAHSDFAVLSRNTDDTPIVATSALVRLYNEKGSAIQDRIVQGTPDINDTDRSIVSPIPIRPTNGRLSLDRMVLPKPKKPRLPKQEPDITSSVRPSTTGARAAAGTAVKSVRPAPLRSQSFQASKAPPPEPPPPRRKPQRVIVPHPKPTTSEFSGEQRLSSSGSSYSSAVDKLPSPRRPSPSRPLPRSASDSLPKSRNEVAPTHAIQYRRTSHGPEPKPSMTRQSTLSTTSLVPQLSADSLANAMVASSLASSRAPSPTKPQLPPPRRHHLFHRAHSSDQISRTPSPAKQMKQTLRTFKQSEDDIDPYKKRRNHFIKKHPNKHHEGDRKRWRDTISEAERKRYEGVWAANKDIVLSPDESPTQTVCNIVTRDIWRRSRLPDDVLEEVWELVSTGQTRGLGKEQFAVGMWLIDQRLKGRKLPARVSESVWGSVRMLSGIKVPKHRR